MVTDKPTLAHEAYAAAPEEGVDKITEDVSEKSEETEESAREHDSDGQSAEVQAGEIDPGNEAAHDDAGLSGESEAAGTDEENFAALKQEKEKGKEQQEEFDVEEKEAPVAEDKGKKHDLKEIGEQDRKEDMPEAEEVQEEKPAKEEQKEDMPEAEEVQEEKSAEEEQKEDMPEAKEVQEEESAEEEQKEDIPEAEEVQEEKSAEEELKEDTPEAEEIQEEKSAEEEQKEDMPEAKEVQEEKPAEEEQKEDTPEAGTEKAPKIPVVKPGKQVQSSEEVDFSDEDAALAGDSPEFDLGDEEDEEDQDQGDKATGERPHDEDLAGKSKNELVNHLATLMENRSVQSLRRDVEAIKIAFYKLHRAETDALRKAFIEDGGLQEDFMPAPDAAEYRFKELFAEYRRRRDEYMANLEHQKEDNLQIKLKIIDDLKELINSGETINHTFNAFRELQQRWRDTGPVPIANNKDLWETYNLHVENFYNFIKINKELRDLDLKRNYETKLGLCEEAEALILEPSIVNAFHKLQKLHEQWRETGPVANEYKEVLWDRFREASGRINKQHQEHFENLKEDQKRNLEMKTELCIKVEELSEQPFTTRKEWNRASEQLIEIQKVWKTIGFAPKKDNTKIYERFRKACDKFFERKRQIYVQLKNEMDLNLQIKQEICAQAEALSGSEEWKKGTDELIAMQKRWKEIGPVPRRYSDAIWKRFRCACDDFFNRKAAHFSSMDSEYDNNLQLKQSLLAEIEKAGTEGITFEIIKNYQRRWSEIGFVPIRHKDSIQKKYKKLMDEMFAAIRGSEGSRQMDRFRDRVSNLKNTGDRRLRFERDRLYNKVKQLEADIALLENNIGFFSKSKNAETMIRDVNEKIRRARDEMSAAIEKINLIDSEDQNN